MTVNGISKLIEHGKGQFVHIFWRLHKIDNHQLQVATETDNHPGLCARQRLRWKTAR